MSYTDGDLLECLRQLADTLGETPTQRQCRNAETTPSAQTYCDRFGGWNDALEVAGLDVNQESVPDDELIAALREFAKKLDETPTLMQVKEASQMPSERVYQDRFGGWNDALEAAGLSINREMPSYTDDELVACLREFADRIGETPTITQLNEEPELPSPKAYRSHFGSWTAALEATGLDVTEDIVFTVEELVTFLQEFATELGHTPTQAELKNREDAPSRHTYENRFGSWNDALRTAGLSVNREVEQCGKTDEELLALLREFAAKHDTSPTQSDADFDPELPSASVFQNRFGSWNKAKQQAGLSTHDRPTRYTDTELLQELQCVAQTVETPLTADDIREADAPSLTTYQRRFDSWNAAKEQAGLVENRETPTQ